VRRDRGTEEAGAGEMTGGVEQRCESERKGLQLWQAAETCQGGGAFALDNL